MINLKENPRIRAIILEMAKNKNQVIYGQQSVNKQLPLNLQRTTKDYDIYTKNPKQSAEELVKKLSGIYKGKKFQVVKGVNPKTYKVKMGKKTIADYTGTTNKPKAVKEFGVQYAKLGYQKKKLKKIIKNPEYEWRHKKDMDTLEKIKRYEMEDFFLD